MYSAPTNVVVVFYGGFNVVVYSSNGVQVRQITVKTPTRSSYSINFSAIKAIAVESISGDFLVVGTVRYVASRSASDINSAWVQRISVTGTVVWSIAYDGTCPYY